MTGWRVAIVLLFVGTFAGAAFGYRAPMVFFDYGSDKVHPAGRYDPRMIAPYWAKVPTVCEPRVLVVGHLDGAEAEEHHNDLDGRRATAVAIVLREEGGAHARIEIVRRGFTQPLVQTTRGVREPQNRRVEIVALSATEAGVRHCGPGYSGCSRTLADGTVCPSAHR